MNPYIDSLKKYLAENEPDYAHADIHSLLEFLWSSYTTCNPIDNAKIKAQITALGPILEKLSLTDSDTLFYLVAGLCLEHERTAFLEGIHVGARLIDELNTWQ